MKKIASLFILVAIAGLVSINAYAHTFDYYGFGYGFGGFGYGMVKGLVADAAEKVFGPARERRAEWASKPKEVREILDAGAANARKKAKEVLLRAQENCGIFPPK